MRSMEHGYRENEMGDAFLENVHEKAKDIIEMNRVEIGDFEGFYKDEKIAADKEYVQTRKDQYDMQGGGEKSFERIEKAKKMSEVMEAIIIDPKVIRSWYGFSDEQGNQLCEVNAMGTSELDDLANGVDAVWELKHVNESVTHLALGVDVTFASEFEEKLQYIKGSIDAGQLAKIEYFMPKWGNMKGEMTQIPRAVIGADAEHLTELSLLWANMDSKRKEVEMHPMQRLILEEIMLQLPVYEKYARKIGQDEIADLINVTYRKFEMLHKIAVEKVSGPQDFIEDDKVFNHLREYLKNFDDMTSMSPSGKLRAHINAKHGV